MSGRSCSVLHNGLRVAERGSTLGRYGSGSMLPALIAHGWLPSAGGDARAVRSGAVRLRCVGECFVLVCRAVFRHWFAACAGTSHMRHTRWRGSDLAHCRAIGL